MTRLITSSYHKICSIGLSGASFRAAKKLIKCHERLASLYQQRIFLKRCRSFHFFPPHIKNMKFPSSLNSSVNNTFKAKIQASLLAREIQQCSATISTIRLSIEGLCSSLQNEPQIDSIKLIASESYNECKSFHKRRLIKKFTWNFTKDHENESADNLALVDAKDLITNYAPESPTKEESALLSKGPKFNISSKLTDKTELDFQFSLMDMAYQLRWKEASSREVDETDWNIPFDKRPSFPPKPSCNLAQKIALCISDANKLLQAEKKKKFVSNITQAEYKALCDLKINDNIYLPSDKGGEFTIIPKSTYLHLGTEHLNDSATYTPHKRNRTTTINKQLQKMWYEIINERRLPVNHAKRLIDKECRTQKFYFLMKTHKEGMKIRPIVSASGGPFDRIGWFLQRILKPLLQHVAAHINSTESLLNQLKNRPKDVLSSASPFSLDVVSMYTNVDIDEAVGIATEYLAEHKIYLYGLHRDNIHELLIFILKNNFFAFQGQYYLQHRGLAMGSRIAPILAILAVDKLERATIYADLSITTIFYKRYVDDSLIVVKTKTDAENILSQLNSAHQSLKFELESPSNKNSINILDCSITIAASGDLQISFFEKKAKKPLFLNEKSAQPQAAKQACVRAEFIRARRICNSEKSIKEADQLIEKKLFINGYSKKFIETQKKAVINRKNINNKQEKATYIKFPFISENFSYKLRRIFNRHQLPIQAVSSSNNTLRQSLAKDKTNDNRCSMRNCQINDPPLCNRTRVVYCVTCNTCNQQYVGSTSQKLHTRFYQHNTQHDSALFAHKQSHSGSCVLSCEVIASAQSLKELLFKEGLLIRKLKPKINRKSELGDVLPFLS